MRPAVAVIGDVIQVSQEDGFLRGHGTQVIQGQPVATMCGVVDRVNKLISVKALGSRYTANIGDVLIGRITEVQAKKWKVDVNSRQDAQLMLSAVNLPGGIQRRRTTVDELNMRSLFVENDLISAEVQAVHQDGSFNLHTRSLKYGKLHQGQLVKVPPYLIKRLTQHFHEFKDYNVVVIFGCNGYVWISAMQQENQTEAGEDVPIVLLETREKMCRIANAIKLLSSQRSFIHPEAVIQTYEVSLGRGIEARDMLDKLK